MNAKGTRILESHNKKSGRYFGYGDLVSGQWWPRLLCVLRDGAHGASQAGIAGIDREGATSVLVAGGKLAVYYASPLQMFLCTVIQFSLSLICSKDMKET